PNENRDSSSSVGFHVVGAVAVREACAIAEAIVGQMRVDMVQGRPFL
ncbi:MAG: hypothetical protein JWP39_1909, partial [Jatrophihabitans sp.]|nr:hypothetical protein [Jatrophihabitans sp.]